jgi:hypothetical protein
MSDSDIPVLNTILQGKKAALAKEMNDAEYFEAFAAEHVLRDERVDPNDIESGLTGTSGENRNGTDGGIDAFYLFVNGKLIRDLEEASALTSSIRKNIVVNIVMLQASTEEGFALSRLTRLSDTIEDIFSLDRQPGTFSENYNEPLSDAIERFRAIHQALLLKRAEFHVSYFYATKGRTATINSDIHGAATDVESKTQGLLATIKEAQFRFLGARELIELAKAPAKFSFPLRCADSITLPNSTACVALVPLKEYLNLITTEKGELRTSLFESNVRDYQGEVAVNDAIGETLQEQSAGKEFWWLNNGITIVAQEVGGTRTQVTLEEPQIVNGLQTSQKIFDYFSSNPEAKNRETRNLLVRMIPATTTDIHDSIIRATNRQTSIPQAYLWATTQIHRDIETLFKGEGLYYDRRKNSWRREGIPLVDVVGMTELAQSVAAILRQEPDHARARPARYFTTNHHAKIFSQNYIQVYALCARIKKKAALFLRGAEAERAHRTNLLFYLIMATVCVALKAAKPHHRKLLKLGIQKIDDGTFRAALAIVRPLYVRFGEDDKAAKGSEFAIALKEALRQKYPFKTRGKKRSN